MDINKVQNKINDVFTGFVLARKSNLHVVS